MTKITHAVAGIIALFTLAVFWTSTVLSELSGSQAIITGVKATIPWGFLLLIPALAVAGGSGFALAKGHRAGLIGAKIKRMPVIAANGLLILIPSALFLASKASAGEFDSAFYSVQVLELLAGPLNIALLGLNLRDGLKLTGRITGTGQSNGARKAEAYIEEAEGGPLIASGVSRLSGTDGQALATRPKMILCRCGASKDKPYCDGSHSAVGFDSRPSDDHTPDGVVVYEGKEIAVYFNRLLCSRSRECNKRMKAVFESGRKPWLIPDNGLVRDIIDVIEACPSGALRYSRPGGQPQHVVPGAAGITIEKNGPYRVVGTPLTGARLAEGATQEKYTLCRCGTSKNKPYCDGQHVNIGWNEDHQ